MLAGNGGVNIVIEIITIIVAVTLMLCSGDPEARLPAVEGLVLTGQINTIAALAVLVTATLGKGTRALRELGGNRGVLGNPVGKGVLAILNDTGTG